MTEKEFTNVLPKHTGARLRKLNLGSGKKPITDAVNVDIIASVNPDIAHDLNNLPWPFKDSQFSEVFAYDIIEHCDDVIAMMKEIHRVSSPGAVVKITVPHFSCANTFIDPTHKHQFGIRSFNSLTGEDELAAHSCRRFRRCVSQIIFAQTLVNKLIRPLANRFPEIYEYRWAWIFPAWFLYFELEVLKEY